jgi:hypothetical protein
MCEVQELPIDPRSFDGRRRLAICQSSAISYGSVGVNCDGILLPDSVGIVGD